MFVHYVAYNGECLTAIVIGDGSAILQADLVVFTNLENVAGKKNFGMQFHQNVELSLEPQRPGTWHMPDHVE